MLSVLRSTLISGLSLSLSLRFLLLSVCLSLSLLTGCHRTVANPTEPIVHLTFWHGVNPPANREILQRLVDRFNTSHPKIQVESLYVGQGDQQIPKILAAVVGNVPPHLLWYAPMLTGQLVELDAILPLEDWLDSLPIPAPIDPALWESMSLEQHLWSVPFSVNNVGVFYRPSLFAAAGITKIPQTWAEFRQVARQLTDAAQGQSGLLLPLGKGEWTVFMWLPFMWSAGGELTEVNAEGMDQITLNNPGAITALQFWRNLIEDGSAILSAPERGYELDQFLAGKAAMQLTGPWTLGQLQPTGVDFAVMPIPQAVRPATSIGGENLFIFKSTPAAEAAAKLFAEYILSEAFQTEWAIATGYLPVNLDARASQTYQTFVAQQPAIQVFLQQAAFGRSRPIFPGYNRLSDALGRAIEAVLLGSQTPEFALQQAQTRLELQLSSRRSSLQSRLSRTVKDQR